VFEPRRAPRGRERELEFRQLELGKRARVTNQGASFRATGRTSAPSSRSSKRPALNGALRRVIPPDRLLIAADIDAPVDDGWSIPSVVGIQ